MYDYLIAFLNCGPIFQTVSHNFYPRTQNGSQNLRQVELSSVSVNADEDEEEGDEEVRMYCQARVQVQGLSQISNMRPGPGACSYI